MFTRSHLQTIKIGTYCNRVLAGKKSELSTSRREPSVYSFISSFCYAATVVTYCSFLLLYCCCCCCCKLQFTERRCSTICLLSLWRYCSSHHYRCYRRHCRVPVNWLSVTALMPWNASKFCWRPPKTTTTTTTWGAGGARSGLTRLNGWVHTRLARRGMLTSACCVNSSLTSQSNRAELWTLSTSSASALSSSTRFIAAERSLSTSHWTVSPVADEKWSLTRNILWQDRKHQWFVAQMTKKLTHPARSCFTYLTHFVINTFCRRKYLPTVVRIA